jgi:hypothetical protein
LVRDLDFDKDWETLMGWYEGHGWPRLDPAMLPEVSFFVPDHACGWLYQSDSCVCWLEFLVTNPKGDKKLNFKALDEIYDTAIIKAKELGFTAIFSSFNHKSLIRLAERKGFEVTETGMTNLVRSI